MCTVFLSTSEFISLGVQNPDPRQRAVSGNDKHSRVLWGHRKYSRLPRVRFTSNEGGPSLENFIPFERIKRLNKRKYFVIPTASHKLHTFVTYKRLIWIQFDPFAHYNIISEVAHNSYNKIFPFGTPFEFFKRNKIFQCFVYVSPSLYHSAEVCKSLFMLFLSYLTTYLVAIIR